MSQYKDCAVGDTVYMWFAANTVTGTAGDGATPLYDVRLAGASSSGAPTASGTPTLLTHANYADGIHEISIDTTGYSTGEYAVFCTLTISSVNPSGFVGSFVVRAASSALYTLIGAIKTKTDNLPSDPADASVVAGLIAAAEAKIDIVDTVVDGIAAKTVNLPSDPADASVIAGLIAAVETKVDTVDTVVDGIAAKTVNLPSDPADASVIAGLIAATEAKVDVVDGIVDAIKLSTDNLPSDPADASVVAGLIAAVDAKVDIIDTIVDAITAKTTNLPSDPADASVVAGLISAVEAKVDVVDTVVDAIKVQTDRLPAGVRKNEELANFEFLMIDGTDHVTPKTGLTITATRSIDGAAFAACTNSAAEISNGVYKITLSAADLNGDVVTFKFTATGADQRTITVKTNE